MNKITILSESSSSGIIIARARPAFWNFGQIVTILIRKDEDNITEVEISSRPEMPYDIFTKSVNWENVERIAGLIYSRATNSEYDPAILKKQIMKTKAKDKASNLAVYILTLLIVFLLDHLKNIWMA